MDVEIRDDMIRLGQVLKLAGVVEDGAQAREAIEAGEGTVNDEVETRRGRQLAHRITDPDTDLHAAPSATVVG